MQQEQKIPNHKLTKADKNDRQICVLPLIEQTAPWKVHQAILGDTYRTMDEIISICGEQYTSVGPLLNSLRGAGIAVWKKGEDRKLVWKGINENIPLIWPQKAKVFRPTEKERKRVVKEIEQKFLFSKEPKKATPIGPADPDFVSPPAIEKVETPEEFPSFGSIMVEVIELLGAAERINNNLFGKIEELEQAYEEKQNNLSLHELAQLLQERVTDVTHN